MAETTTSSDGAASTETEFDVPEWLTLEADEEIEWIGEPVPVSLVGTAVWGVILSIVLIGLLILLSLPFSWLSIKNTDYVVTDKSLYVKKGILGTNIESVGLDKIQNTEFRQSFWGKQFGFGSIDISTAGSSGAEITFQNVENARDVRERITRLSNEYSGGSRRSRTENDDTTGKATTAPPGEGMAELIEELRATRQALERVERSLHEESQSVDDAPSTEQVDEPERTDSRSNN